MSVATYTKSGNKATTAAKLDKAIFGVLPDNHQLLQQAYVAYMANGRGNNAQVKTRGEIRGGGKKPWKQKGTGRARFGSSRNPIWRGGGIVFGPTGNENYSKKLNISTKRLAIRQALSVAADTNRIIVLEDLNLKDGKTADAVKLLNKVGANTSALVVVENKTPETDRSMRNLGNVKLVQAKYLNVFDVMNSDNLVITNGALSVISEWLSPSPKVVGNKGDKKA